MNYHVFSICLYYLAGDMCNLYGQDCDHGEKPSHDSGDDMCEQDGISFIDM